MNTTLLVLIAGLAVTIVAELVGVFRHGDHKVDTISEIYWTLRARLGPWSTLLALPLAAGLAWLWWHLTYQGRHRHDRS